MRDIPMFCTELGVASLVLKKIPYTKEAYIHFRDSGKKEAFLRECCDFCVAAGAESVYATGDDFLTRYPHHTTIVKMQCSRDVLADTDAMLFPVQENTAEGWREIYNQKMLHVPNAAYMTLPDAKKRAGNGELYFVHKGGSLIGIGAVCGNCIEVLASVIHGAGEDVLLALCTLVTDPVITLTVANNNLPAVALYERLGFVAIEETEKWYKII